MKNGLPKNQQNYIYPHVLLCDFPIKTQAILFRKKTLVLRQSIGIEIIFRFSFFHVLA